MPEIVRTVDIPFDDGTTRTVLMNIEARIEAESAVPLPDGSPRSFYEITNMDGLTPVRALLWAGRRAALRAEDRKAEAAAIRLPDVNAWLEDININELAAWLALAVAIGDKATTRDEDAKKKAEDRTAAMLRAWKEEPSIPSGGLPSDPATSPTENSAS